MQFTVTIEDDLYNKALELADPTIDKADLLQEALKTFVQVRFAKRLIALGGKAPAVRAIHERVINGDIDFDEAVREVLNETLVCSSAKMKESQLRGSVLKYEQPTGPVNVQWNTSD